MKFIKILTIMFSFFLITGCDTKNGDTNTINYSLKISDIFEENINFILPSNAYEIAEETKDDEFSSLEFILLHDKQEPIHSNHDEKYIKTIDKNKDNVIVNLKYNYIENDFINSNYIHNCFENYTINSEEDFFEITLSGEFYCRYDRNINIKIISNHNILSTNGNKVENSVIWNINDNNYKNVNINYKISRNYDTMAQVAFNDETNENYVGDLIKSVAIMAFVGIAGFIIIKIIKKKFELE